MKTFSKNDLSSLMEAIVEVGKLRGSYDILVEQHQTLATQIETLIRENERLRVENEQLLEQNRQLKYNLPFPIKNNNKENDNGSSPD